MFFCFPLVMKKNPANLIGLNYLDLFSNTWQEHRIELVMVDKKDKDKGIIYFSSIEYIYIWWLLENFV